ncbi:MAG TPA: hypothetical protein VJS63_16665 [Bradyrhizobium sp.]|nr:hypothetical protein [Bradyrhizobium sp.]
MGNVYSPVRKQDHYSTTTSSLRNDEVQNNEDEAWDGDVDKDLVSLLEENARLRALVVRLSDLVLRNVIDQK